ncbi:hypothetical protein KA977_11270, partial [Candidatus Dependentiae bacterium]|nr:hypothetical protein [Candidatus Dependentiae bacterium]
MSILQYKKKFNYNTFAEAAFISNKAAETIGNGIKYHENLITQTAANIKNIQLSDSGILQLLKDMLKKNQGFYQFGIAFKPNRFKNKKLYAPFFNKKGSDYGQILYENYQNYTDSSCLWYNSAIKKDTGTWTEPHYDNIFNIYSIDFSIPFYLSGNDSGQADGVIAGKIALSDLKSLFANIPINKEGYVIAFSKSFKYIYHPKKNYIADFNNYYYIMDDKIYNKIKIKFAPIMDLFSNYNYCVPYIY